jgi:hypothetical protein
MAELGRRSVDDDPGKTETSRRELDRRRREQRVGLAGWVVITGASVLGAVLLLVGYSAAAMTCAVTAGVLWLLLQIPDAPESDGAVRSSVRTKWSRTSRQVYADRLGTNTADPVKNKEGAPVSAPQRIHHDNRVADASEASCLLSAAVRWQERPIGPVGRYDNRSASATGHLLETLGHALVRDTDSIPPEVTRVALRLARASGASSRSASAGVEDRDHDRHSPSSRSAATPPSGTGAGWRLAPFTSSIRFGRTG